LKTSKLWLSITNCLYEVWLWSSWSTFTASILCGGVSRSRSPLSSYARCPVMLSLLEPFLELLLWSCFFSVVTFSLCLLISWNLRPSKADSFGGGGNKSHSQPNKGNKVDVLFH
jgi:hypothetical protein